MSRRVVLAAALASTDCNVLASCLAFPAFLARWQAGQWPEFPVIGIHHG